MYDDSTMQYESEGITRSYGFMRKHGLNDRLYTLHRMDINPALLLCNKKPLSPRCIHWFYQLTNLILVYQSVKVPIGCVLLEKKLPKQKVVYFVGETRNLLCSNDNCNIFSVFLYQNIGQYYIKDLQISNFLSKYTLFQFIWPHFSDVPFTATMLTIYIGCQKYNGKTSIDSL